ncbi:MAG: 4-(cytidine 5'-diphospho)-2-C-methyl-D-erythritol kinase [Ruminococcus sp.]|nr:4-(cytidine 5'-diphospho)-2-C-methyl-D-erythritol kinase [Ruminococcus sp.]
MKIKTPAKINLALDVTGKLENGYHTIESVFQTVGLYDEVEVTLNSSGINITCELPADFAKADPIPCDERNIAFKAAKLFSETTGYSGGCDIHIVKGIPSQAGMGGGSTDAAAVLYCMNSLTGNKIGTSELAAMGKKLGADVPFFFTGGTAYVEGIGEKISPLPDYSGRVLVIAKGTEGVSTAEAYANIDALTSPLHPPAHELVNALKTTPEDAHNYFGNLFEQAVQLEEVDDIKSVMVNSGALKAVMTGSGSAVFGLFSSTDAAEVCAEKLREKSYFAAVCMTVADTFIE